MGYWPFFVFNPFNPKKYSWRTHITKMRVMVNFRMTRIPYTTPVSQDVPRLLGHCSRVFLQLLWLSATASAAVIYDEAPTASYRVMPVTWANRVAVSQKLYGADWHNQFSLLRDLCCILYEIKKSMTRNASHGNTSGWRMTRNACHGKNERLMHDAQCVLWGWRG